MLSPGNGREAALQIAGKVQNDLLRPLGVLSAEIIDAHQRIIDEVGPHLQNGHLGPLPYRLLLLLLITPDQAGHQI